MKQAKKITNKPLLADVAAHLELLPPWDGNPDRY